MIGLKKYNHYVNMLSSILEMKS